MAGKARKPGVTTAALLVLLVLALTTAGARSRPAQEPAKEKPTPPPPAEYIGSEACGACHEAARAVALQFHNQLEVNKRFGWVGRGCEGCHGPGKAHAESADKALILSFKDAAATQVSKACLKCHGQALRGADRVHDAHMRNSVSCVACHAVHKPGARPLLASKPETSCVACHSNVMAEFSRPHRHKLLEGVVGCVDCHNPHGSPQKSQTRRYAGNDAACLKCHGDKRGPFVYEHPPVRLEGCQSCHEPHGSVNPRLLKRADMRFLCLECHSPSASTLGGPIPAIHDLRLARFQNCTTCHIKIHGSYVNKAFFR